MVKFDEQGDDDDFGPQEFENVDWAATCAIYGEETEVNSKKEGGFRGTVHLPISVSAVGFFRKITSQNQPIKDDVQFFRYFSISQTPILRIDFDYPKTNETDDSIDYELDDECTFPQSVHVRWELYPEEWPMEEKQNYTKWLSDKCNDILTEEQMSFPVCEFCDHDTLSFWDLFYQDNDEFNHRLIQLPQKMDHFHHSNVGTLIEPRETAQKEMTSLIDSHESINDEKKKKIRKKTWTSIEQFARQTMLNRWKYLYKDQCPICFDTITMSLGITLPCGHFFCSDCLPIYFQMKVKELQTYRTNPFLCPIEKCRQELSIAGIVKKHISTQDMDRVRKWIKDLKHPPCFSLDRCLVPSCKAIGSMRKRYPNNNKSSNNSAEIFCEVCNVSRCELCLKRTMDTDKNGKIMHPRESCDAATLLQFCERYLLASDNKKRLCQEKYPWIVSYANFVRHDGGAISWILENGQLCPNCGSGVERIEGCFHMKCPTCATHFCYECGEELVPPYYGNHHCWERSELDL